MYRLRSFRKNRFHDKAAIYATAEYRMTLDYNPIANVSWLKFLHLDWLQTVFYVEGEGYRRLFIAIRCSPIGKLMLVFHYEH